MLWIAGLQDTRESLSFNASVWSCNLGVIVVPAGTPARPPAELGAFRVRKSCSARAT